ncbi:MAG: hypothetical protein ACRD0Q_03855 [Acidimicrobiales bacterium]
MNLRFRALPGEHDLTPRPMITVGIDGIESTGFDCLIDTGSLENRFGAWIADEAGIDLTGAEAVDLGLGGHRIAARTVPVALRLGRYAWEAPVSFCEPWPWGFNLLGQEGFLRWFRVVFEAADRSLEITPHP